MPDETPCRFDPAFKDATVPSGKDPSSSALAVPACTGLLLSASWMCPRPPGTTAIFYHDEKTLALGRRPAQLPLRDDGDDRLPARRRHLISTTDRLG